MFLLLSDPRISIGLTLEAGISAGESAEFIDIDGKCTVRFRDNPIISHAFNMASYPATANWSQAAAAYN